MTFNSDQFQFQCKNCDAFPYARAEDLAEHIAKDHNARLSTTLPLKQTQQPWGSTTTRVEPRGEPEPDPAYDQEAGLKEYKRQLRKRAETESKPFTKEQRQEASEDRQYLNSEKKRITRTAKNVRSLNQIARAAAPRGSRAKPLKKRWF